jgi:hypothetical protein
MADYEDEGGGDIGDHDEENDDDGGGGEDMIRIRVVMKMKMMMTSRRNRCLTVSCQNFILNSPNK